MRTVFAVVGLALLCCFAVAEDSPDTPDFVPCSFTVQFYTEVTNTDGEVVASSRDRFIRDGDNDLWRWDSDFTSNLPIIESQKWIVIWRPDLNVSYHDYGDKCVKNNGRSTMAPRVYQWLWEKTNGINWFTNVGTYDGLPCYIYYSHFVVKQYKTTMTCEIYTLKSNGALLLINGTAKSDSLDLRYNMDVEFFEQHEEVLPTYFMPAAHCSETPIAAPPAPTAEFDKTCYGIVGGSSMGVRAVVSWVAVLLAIVAMIM